MSIVENRKAFHDYFIEERFEAGLALEGWEVKSIRAGRANLKEAYVVIKNGEIVLIGAHMSPLSTASTHVRPDPTRTRKLLMHRVEINRLIGKVERAGYTLTPLNLHFTKGRIKLEVGLARGKKQYDKREAEKLRDWDREKRRLLRNRTGAVLVSPTANGVVARTDDGEWRAGMGVVACGSWAPKVLEGVALPPLLVTREQVFYFRPRDAGGPWPSFIHHRTPYIYGLARPVSA